ncbi:MAG: discoidin domain-containing protein [Odoribacteraceae bacterium]|jgi:hypothetical protein|nr:discoidin domain-containing protein [Odoribacteraceae bacterium]
MKSRNILHALLLPALLCAACNNMTDIYQDYLDRGETIYIGRADSLQLFPGNGRVKLEWEINADPKLVDCIIYWDERADSLVVPIVRDAGGGRQKMSVIIDGLSERGHIFEIRTRDLYQRVSLKTEKSVTCYGERYAASLSNRAITTQVIDPDADNVTISWGVADNSVGVEFRYVNRDGVTTNVLIPPTAAGHVFADFVPGREFSYSTLYLPVATSIDTFRTAPVVMNFARLVLNKANWVLVEETSHGDYGGFGDGWRAFDGRNDTGWHSGWSGETLPQWITVDLKGIFTVVSVELVRPDDSWREETEIVEVWACANAALDPLDPANFQKVATVHFVGDEKSRVVTLAEPADARFLKFIGTQAIPGKDAIQISEINLEVVE